MARSGFIDITFSTHTEMQITKFLDSFFNCGWSINIDNKIWHTDVGDNEDFNWVTTDIHQYEKVIETLNKKQMLRELIALALIFPSTGNGIDLIIYPDFEKVTFGLYRNRKVLSNLDITDFSWYLKHIVLALDFLSLNLEKIECLDS